jgi:hypothetical protein
LPASSGDASVTIFDFLVSRPPMPDDPDVLGAFDRLVDEAVARGPGSVVDYRLPYPRWQFICHIADTRDVVLHGSGDPDIARFEPRQPNDSTVFGNQKAVYAASDGLWPMYFAILDRPNVPFLINASFRLATPDGLGDPYYFFSISRPALEKRAFRRGTIYFLPRKTFHQQRPETRDGETVHIPQWASFEPVVPLCKIAVGPEDFPLLAEMRGHDDEDMLARIKAKPDGFPWLDE